MAATAVGSSRRLLLLRRVLSLLLLLCTPPRSLSLVSTSGFGPKKSRFAKAFCTFLSLTHFLLALHLLARLRISPPGFRVTIAPSFFATYLFFFADRHYVSAKAPARQMLARIDWPPP